MGKDGLFCSSQRKVVVACIAVRSIRSGCLCRCTWCVGVELNLMEEVVLVKSSSFRYVVGLEEEEEIAAAFFGSGGD